MLHPTLPTGILRSLVLVALLSAPARAVTVTLTPTPVATAPDIDGHLDEALWADAARLEGFVQQRPDTGAPAGQPTVVRVVYTEEALYFGFLCAEADPSRLRRQALGRDADVGDDDHLALVLDTFHDRQDGYLFATNPNGVRYDALFRNEGDQENPDWDAVWSVRTLVTEDGWQGEIEIPWRTLRFPPRDAVTMGLNVQRQRRAVNEQSHWSPVARQFTLTRVSQAGTLEDLRGIRPGRNLVVRPFALARTSRGDARDDDAWTGDDWFGETDAGLDAKWGLSSQLTLDVTVNTDFAQVEADDEVVNLTRFPLFFPEKREFFLEKRDFFEFGSPSNYLFFSRRIGLERGPEGLMPVPIAYGARLTGKIGRTDLGVLDMRTREDGAVPARQFDVVRLSQDVGGSSRVGAMFVRRDPAPLDGAEEPVNHAYGVDADLSLFGRLDGVVYAADTDQEGLGDDTTALGTRWRWSDPLYSVSWFYEALGTDYSPAVGFVPRGGINQHAFGWGFTPEPNRRWFRRSDTHGQFFFAERRHGDFETRYTHFHPVIVAANEARLGAFWDTNFERLFEPFAVGGDVVIPAGDYDFHEWGVNGSSDPSQAVVLSGHVRWGDYFDADASTLELELEGHWAPHWTAAVVWVRDRIERDDPGGTQSLESDVARVRLSLDVSNDLSLDLFTQWNSEARRVLSQFRAHYLFGDESDVYVVVGDARDDERFAPRQQEWVLKVAWARRL